MVSWAVMAMPTLANDVFAPANNSSMTVEGELSASINVSTPVIDEESGLVVSIPIASDSSGG